MISTVIKSPSSAPHTRLHTSSSKFRCRSEDKAEDGPAHAGASIQQSCTGDIPKFTRLRPPKAEANTTSLAQDTLLHGGKRALSSGTRTCATGAAGRQHNGRIRVHGIGQGRLPTFPRCHRRQTQTERDRRNRRRDQEPLIMNRHRWRRMYSAAYQLSPLTTVGIRTCRQVWNR